MAKASQRSYLLQHEGSKVDPVNRGLHCLSGKKLKVESFWYCTSLL